MFYAITPAGFLLVLILVLSGAGAGIGDALAIDKEAATRVGGDLSRYGEKLAVLRMKEEK